MKPVKDLFHDLVDRRLWPVALLLVVAIVAVPVLLGSKSDGATTTGDASAATAAAGTASGPVAVSDTSVVATTASGRGLRRDARVNPFVYRGVFVKGKKTTKAKSTSTGATSASADSGSKSGSTGGTSGATQSTPAAKSTAPVYKLASVRVRFGRVESARKERGISRLSPLPGSDSPVLIDMGVVPGTKTVVFLVSSDVHAEGDGRCKPSAASCQTVWVKEGQTEFFDVTKADGTVRQYQLDVVSVKYSRTTSKSKAASTLLHTAKPAASPTGSPTGTTTTDGASQRLPAFSDLTWSSKLGQVVGVPESPTDDAGSPPRHPIVIPDGDLSDLKLR
jgi:hypothetical protein